ncbi:MAG: calcium-binding protein [Hyphomicrobiaceae bacterium]
MATTTYNIGQGSLRSSTLTVRAAEESIVFGDNRNNVITISPRSSAGDLGDEVHGGGGNDVIRAARTDDRLFGDDGNDIIYGGDGNDQIEGGNGDDILRGDDGDDTIEGGNGEDVLYGGDGNDQLAGGADDDILDGGSGDDALDGGTGADTLLGGFGNDTISGGDGDDLIVGSFGNDTILGGAGNDTIQGGAEDDPNDPVDDYIDGGDGDDLILAESGNDVILGGGGNDTIYASTGADQVDGGDGDDTIDGGGDNDVLLGGAGDDLIRAGSGDDMVDGGSGNDRLEGSNGADILLGGDGDDILVGGDGARDANGVLIAGDTLDGGDGYDIADYSDSTTPIGFDFSSPDAEGYVTGFGGTAQGDRIRNIESIIGGAAADVLIGDDNANILSGGGGDDQIDGRGGDDILSGGDGADLLIGGDGNDILIGGANGVDPVTGANVGDTLVGGAGIDTVDYSSSPASDPVSGAGVTVGLSDDPNAATVGSGGDAEGDLIVGVENIIGSAFNDTLVGNSAANVLDGGAGNDQIDGNGGDDTLIGGAGVNLLIGDAGNDTFIVGDGTDTMIGGADFDTADYSGAAGGILIQSATISGQPGLAGTAGEAAGDILLDVERVIGTAYGDVLIGNALANTFIAGAGNDLLRGGGGADTLEGGVGIDTLDYTGSAAGVTVVLRDGGLAAITQDRVTSDGNDDSDAAGDVATGFENVYGSAFADWLQGNSDNNLLRGAGGADIIFGGAGIDTADYATSAAGVSIAISDSMSSGPAGVGGDAAGDIVLADVENLTGSAFADFLRGNLAANVLNGGAGDDILRGGAGADTLIGGDGMDLADYSTSSAGVSVSISDNPGSARVGVGGDAEGDLILGDIEGFIGSAFADNLRGNVAANQLFGGAGNDVLRGGGGADLLDGGDGSDIADYSTSASGVSVNLTTGAVSGGDAAGDTLTSIEGLIGSSNGGDLLVGNSLDNYLRTGLDNSTDQLRGGNGADFIISEGGGQNQLYGDGVTGEAAGDPPDGEDTFVILSGSTGQTIIFDYDFNADPDIADDIIIPYSPVLRSVTLGGQAALMLDGPTHDTFVMLNGVSVSTAVPILAQNLTIDPGFVA